MKKQIQKDLTNNLPRLGYLANKRFHRGLDKI